MSLKFGIYLVEQRIISPEQFCGLVKIQQEATMSFATIAIRKNMLTIKQVAMILDKVESNIDKSFLQTAMEMDLIDQADAEEMWHMQQASTPTIRRLVIECGLLTQRQTAVLHMHYEKNGASGFSQAAPIKKPNPKSSAPQETSMANPAVRKPKFQSHSIQATQASTPSTTMQ